MGRVAKLLARGADYIAKERGLILARKAVTLTTSDKSLWPVAGDSVIVYGKPVTKTGRVLSGNPLESVEDAFRALRFGILIDRLSEARSEVAARLTTKNYRTEAKRQTVKLREGRSLYAFYKNESRVLHKRKGQKRFGESTGVPTHHLMPDY